MKASRTNKNHGNNNIALNVVVTSSSGTREIRLINLNFINFIFNRYSKHNPRSQYASLDNIAVAAVSHACSHSLNVNR